MLRFMRFSITTPIDTNHMWPLMLPLISRLCLSLLFLGSQRSNLLKFYRLKSLMYVRIYRKTCISELNCAHRQNYPSHLEVVVFLESTPSPPPSKLCSKTNIPISLWILFTYKYTDVYDAHWHLGVSGGGGLLHLLCLNINSPSAVVVVAGRFPPSPSLICVHRHIYSSPSELCSQTNTKKFTML